MEESDNTYQTDSEYDIERPENEMQSDSIEFDKNDEKWYGVPPKGEQPIPRKFLIFEGRLAYVFMIFGIILLEICIWAVYRYSTAAFFESFGTHQFYLAHIIAAPTIHLLPIILFWWYIRRERGFPFVFTKKLLLTGVLVGFIAAIIWRLFEEFFYDAFAGLAGGTVPGTFTFLNYIETVDLFILMTFVMYAVVGPVEELEFRSFAHDQAARVLPNWQALIFSSVLFGCSHIPIAMFVYKLSPTQFVDALVGWISAGFVFGALYMWSRNIFTCIIMHAMGNWQLSVFYFESVSTSMAPTTAMGVGIATSLVVNGIMIMIFYMIHKYYWQPHRRGEPAFGGKLYSLQKYLHEHDFGQRSVQSTIIVAAVFIIITSGIILGATASMGKLTLPGFEPVTPSDNSLDLEAMVELRGFDNGSGTLEEGMGLIIPFNSEPDHYIKEITVTVTWTDEPDIQRVRTYENQPDTFTVMIMGANATASDQGSNPHGGEGSITTELSFSTDEVSQIIDSDGENYEFMVEILLNEAGNYQLPLGPIGYQDPGNEFSYQIEIIWLVPE